MSKDIRSFFVRDKKINTTPQETKKKVVQRKRSAIVIDSDSEEESILLSSKKSKSSPVKDQNCKVFKEKQTTNKKDEMKIASKYFTGEKVNAADVFGSRPIKRDNSRNIVKKVVTAKISQEFHFDEDFESELLLLDDVGTDILPKDSTLSKHATCETGRDNSKKSPEKASKTKYNSNKVENESCMIKNKINTKLEKTKYDSNLIESPKKKVTNSPFEIVFNMDMEEIPSKKIKRSDSKRSPYKLSPQKILSRSPVKSSPSKNCAFVEFVQLATSSPPKTNPVVSPLKSEKNQVQSKEKSKTDRKLVSPRKSPRKCRKTDLNWVSPIKIDSSAKTSSENSCNKAIKKEESSPVVNDQVASLSQATYNLWVDKYKPTSTKQIIGQQGDKSCVNKLTNWLKNWHKNQNGNKKIMKPSPWAKNDDGRYFKAALLSGPPGVGKTTTAHLVSRELGFDVVEFNASDTRSKKLLHQEVSELLSTNSLSPFFTGKGEGVSKKHVLLMDEVDGMAGNEDRGGVQELIQLIRQSRIPVICMCNDRNHPKIRSLANYCFDLRFSKPRAEQIKGAMMSVCFKEKLKVTPNVLTDIITSANQDIRLIINHLSMLSVESSDLANSSKHVKMGPWDITRKIFSEQEHKSMSINDKSDLFFHDYNVTPLFVQENYLNAVPHKPEGKNKIKKMELFAAAARSLSLGDLTEKNIRSNNAWSLLPVQAVFSSLVPGEILEGHIGAQINFPAWFGKNSRQTKMSRLLQELTVHARLKISGNKEAMNLDYLTPLEKSILLPLVELGSDGIPQALSVLSEYSLVREDLESMSELSSWPNTKNQFSEVESKVKAAFTRAYNKTSAPTPYAAVPIKKGSRSEVENMDAIPEEGEEESQPMEEEEEEDGLEVDAMIMVKKKPTGKIDKEVGPSTSKGSKNSKRGRKR